MAWRVALILDTETNLNVATGEMPIWAQTTPKRASDAAEYREQWDSMWYPEPGFTLITTSPVSAEDLEKTAAGFLPTLADHHPNLYSVYLFGVPGSESLNVAMAEGGFYPTHLFLDSGLVFARLLEESEKELLLDAGAWDKSSAWRWESSFYDAFFEAVEAPAWHGRNLDALNDSIGGGGINQVEVPYKIVIQNMPQQNPLIAPFLEALSDLAARLRSQGCPVQLQTSSQDH